MTTIRFDARLPVRNYGLTAKDAQAWMRGWLSMIPSHTKTGGECLPVLVKNLAKARLELAALEREER